MNEIFQTKKLRATNEIKNKNKRNVKEGTWWKEIILDFV